MKYLPTTKRLAAAVFTFYLAAVSLAPAAYDPTWSRTDCGNYSYRGLYERYVYGSNQGWINNNKWDSSSVEGVDCAAYVSRCLALPEYVAESVGAKYPYDTLELYEGAPNTTRITSINDLQQWDLWVYRGSSNHTGLFKQYDGTRIITREARSAESGIVEGSYSKQYLIDRGARYYRRSNWVSQPQPPTVATKAATGVTYASATLNATLTSPGTTTVDQRGFKWGTTTACADGWVTGVSSGDNFSASLSGLSGSKTYYFQAGAHNSIGWSYGDALSFRTAAAPTNPVYIIDNGQSGTSYTGTWGFSNAADPYGTTSLWAREGATYTWSYPSLPAGTYTVSMWWTELSSRSATVPVAITYSGGTAQTTVNQRTNGGQWNLLGQYYFSGTGSVRITANGVYPVSTCADAVKFTLVQTNQTPVAVIDSITPVSPQTGQIVEFRGHGTDDGTITAYAWSSNLDGTLGTTATLKISTLRVGTHTISFRVCDNMGVWSSTAKKALTVTEPSTAEIIIDNGDPQTSYTGLWKTSGGEGCWEEDSLYGRDGATYTWAASDLTPGRYEVFMWWTEFSTRSSTVPLQIAHANGVAELTVNQQTNGGQWNSLGQFYFSGSSNVTLFAPLKYPNSYCADAVKFVMVSSTPPEEIIVDNGESAASASGTWGVSGGDNPYGDDSLWARETAQYRWTFRPQHGGTYEVFLWWTEFPSRGTEVPVDVTTASGTTQITVDQQTNGGQWNSIGTYYMGAGQSVQVQISTTGDGTTTCADAARILWIYD